MYGIVQVVMYYVCTCEYYIRTSTSSELLSTSSTCVSGIEKEGHCVGGVWEVEGNMLVK